MASVTFSNALIGLDAVLSPQVAITVAVVAGYVALCRALRYAKRDKEHAQRPYNSRDDFKKMSAEEAWQIIQVCAEPGVPLDDQEGPIVCPF